MTAEILYLAPRPKPPRPIRFDELVPAELVPVGDDYRPGQFIPVAVQVMPVEARGQQVEVWGGRHKGGSGQLVRIIGDRADVALLGSRPYRSIHVTDLHELPDGGGPEAA